MEVEERLAQLEAFPRKEILAWLEDQKSHIKESLAAHCKACLNEWGLPIPIDIPGNPKEEWLLGTRNYGVILSVPFERSSKWVDVAAKTVRYFAECAGEAKARQIRAFLVYDQVTQWQIGNRIINDAFDECRIVEMGNNGRPKRLEWVSLYDVAFDEAPLGTQLRSNAYMVKILQRGRVRWE